MLSSSKMEASTTGLGLESAGKGLTAEPQWKAALWLTLALLLALAPVWTSSTLPTSDGASHVYNAMVAGRVRAGQAPFDSRFTLRTFPRSNFASDSTLRFFGPAIGWEAAERVLAGFTILLAGIMFYFLAKTALDSPFAGAIAAWLAGNWFFWMGFYDFSLSLAAFAGLVLALRASRSRLQWLWVALSFIALYATHLFTFAAGTALLIWIMVWRAAHRQIRPAVLTATLLPIAVLAYELFAGPVGSGGISWSGWKAFERALIGLGIGDFLISLTWIGLAAGIALMAATWAGIFSRFRHAVASRQWDPIDLFALAAFAVSLAVPDHIATGLYTAARTRGITVVLLLPSTVAFCSRRIAANTAAGRAIRLAIPALLLLALGAQDVLIVRSSHAVSRQLAAMEHALRNGGVGTGDWVDTILVDRSEPIVRINAFNHVPERAYLRVGACALDNYEATIGNFEVRWRRPPDVLNKGLAGFTWSVSREPHEMPWDGGLRVLYDARFNLTTNDPALAILPGPSTNEPAGNRQFRLSRIEVK